MSGTTIADMTTSGTVPTGSFVPFVVTDPTTGLSPSENYRYNLGADLLTRVSYTALALSTAAGQVGEDKGTTVQAALDHGGWSGSFNFVSPCKIDDMLEHGSRLSRYGFMGNSNSTGTTGANDTQAYRDAVLEASELGIQRIIVPVGQTGFSKVTGAIVDDDNPLPPGLTFESEAPRSANPYVAGPRIIYTGAETCFFVNYQSTTPAELGGWTWKNLGIEATNPAATIFDFNDTVNTIPDVFGAPAYLIPLRFEGCYLKGAQGGVSQTGDGIRGCKAYQLYADNQSYIRGFRRGIWLKGCDDGIIDCRMDVNTRSVMIERSGSPIQYGTGVQIRSAFIGSAGIEGSEDAYLIWDNGFYTKVFGTNLEGFTGVGPLEIALVYLDGFGTLLMPGLASEQPLFQLGPNARAVRLDATDLLTSDSALAPIIEDPASWDFGAPQSDYRMKIIGGGKNLATSVGAHPRILWVGRSPMEQDVGSALPVPIDNNAVMAFDSAGYRPQRHVLTPFNIFSRNRGTVVDEGAILSEDATVSGGWVFEADNDPDDCGINATFLIGTDWLIGDRVKLTIRAKSASNDWYVVVRKNEVFNSLLIADVTGGSYTVFSGTVDLSSGWANGDRISFTLLNQDGDATDPIFVHYIAYEKVLATVTSPTGGAVVDTQSRASIDEIKARLTAAGITA